MQLSSIDEKQPLRPRSEAITRIVAEQSQKKQLRYNVISNFVAQSTTLAREMQEPLAAEWTAVGNDFSQARLTAVEAKCKELMLLAGDRTNTVSFAVADVTNLWKELGVDVKRECTSALELQIQRVDPGKLGISRDIIAQLQQRKAALIALKEQRAAECKQITAKLEDWYTRLNTPQSERQAFAAKIANTTLTPATMKLYVDEYARMDAIKRSNAQVLIGQVRTAISGVWTAMHMTNEQKRAAFAGFYEGMYLALCIGWMRDT